MSMQCFSKLEEVKLCLEDILDEKDLQIHGPVDVVKLPPDPAEVTDCEDFDSDILLDQNFPREIPGNIELQYMPINDEGPDSSEEGPSLPKRSHKEVVSLWSKVNAEYTNKIKESNRYEEYKISLYTKFWNLDPHEIFEYFFDESIMDSIVQESIRYSQQKSCHTFSVSPNCIRKFLGILLFTCYHAVPQEKMYWSEDDDINLTMIRNCMSRNRYMEIKRYLHFNNNDEIKNTNDKSFKIKPLIDKLNENFLKVNIFSKYLSIDKQMVQNYGGNFLKQFIHGKPIRFGFKQWIMACAETGYCYQMELYQGKKDSQQNELTDLDEKTITCMVSLLEHPEDHEIYFDNYFSSFHLMQSLSQKNIRATGRVRANRINNCPIKTDMIMKNECQGSYDYCFDKKNEILVVTWKDNSCVKVLSNHQAIHPLATVKRYNKLAKKKIDVHQPYVIAQYNKYKGGVEKLDWHINKYNVKIQGKKWYFRLFTNAIDITMYNAFVIYNLSHEKISYLDFIRHITRTYLNISSEHSDPKLAGRPSRMLKEVRIITDHVLERTVDGKQKRCAVCKKNCRKQCVGCNRAMHMDCFSVFHTIK